MERIDKILVALSFETKEQAEINHALALAKLYGSKITLFSVIPELSNDEQLKISAMSPEERLKQMVFQREEKLATYAESVSDAGCSVESYVAVGKPSDEIIRHATEHEHDLVVIGTRLRKSIKEKLFGSTSNAVLRKSPTPVLAVKLDHSGQYKRIMASVDISQDPNIINKKILSEADSLAKSNNSELHAHTVITSKVAADTSASSQETAKNKLADLVFSLNLETSDVGIHISAGEAVSVIPEQTHKHNIDLLVMGMASRTGIKGFFLGNLAERILSSVDCSILTVKPDGFKG